MVCEQEYYIDLETREILSLSEYVDDEETEKLRDRIEEKFDRYERIPKAESLVKGRGQEG